MTCEHGNVGTCEICAKRDHRAKILDKLAKMQASAESEAKIGNSAAAEAFAAAVNRMMLTYELNESDIDYARNKDDDPVIELRVDLSRYGIDAKRTRIAWQESLARIVARAHLCSFLVQTGSNNIYFIGTKSHVTVAEYVFGTLVPAASNMSRDAYIAFRKETTPRDGSQKRPETYGFTDAWLNSFVKRIAERLEESRRAAVADSASSSTALMRIDTALTLVRDYMKANYDKGTRVQSLSTSSSANAEGSRRGRAAADALHLSKGLSSSSKGQLK